jgi:PhoH-like ATPase
MKKTLCIDTNVFLYDPNALFAFEDNDVVIPLAVLEEIDEQKNRRFDDVGKNARVTNRLLDELRQHGDLLKGVALPGGGMLRIVKSEYDAATMPAELREEKIDNCIISTVLKVKRELEKSEHRIVKLITKDISMRIKCDMLGVPCEDYLKHRVIGQADLIYGGVRVISTLKQNIDSFYANKSLDVSSLELDGPLLPNEYVVLKDIATTSGSVLTKFSKGNLVPIINYDDIWGLKPKNKEQRFALDSLMDKDTTLVTMIGKSGCGKTLLAIAAGLLQVLEQKKYTKLVVTRPIQPVGRDIGFLPGTKEEKMEPWIQPIIDNLEYLFSSCKSRDSLKMYFDEGIIEVEAITYIRGRSIPNAYMIIDEAQNLAVNELKTIITRVGEGTKIVLTGDIEQLDNNDVDAVSNGLSYAVEKFKTYELSGHISLIKGERSELATLAAEIL